MTQNSFSTVDATSDVKQRLEKAISDSSSSLSAEKLQKLNELQEKVKSLRKRGLLNKNEFVSVSTADFERRYSDKSVIVSSQIGGNY